jgi:hypothetical protein
MISINSVIRRAITGFGPQMIEIDIQQVSSTKLVVLPSIQTSVKYFVSGSTNALTLPSFQQLRQRVAPQHRLR